MTRDLADTVKGLRERLAALYCCKPMDVSDVLVEFIESELAQATAAALQLTDAANWEEIARWCGGSFFNAAHGVPGSDPKTYLRIRTLEGTMEASENDWIIKGVKGEFYPCKPDIFEATYEPAEGAAPKPEGGKL